MRYDPTLSHNCRAQHGMPHRPTRCTGCGCSCHAVRPPRNFRALVDAARARDDEAFEQALRAPEPPSSAQCGEALPLDGFDDLEAGEA